MHFCVFKAFFILNGYCYSGEMNRARDSVSKPHAEKSNPTSRTDFSSKTLRNIFLGHPVLNSLEKETAQGSEDPAGAENLQRCEELLPGTVSKP